jgi:hypothetical protein
MGRVRFLYDNLITAESMITVSSLRNGIVTAALKSGTGSAVLNPSGNYSGVVDLEYIIEIDSIAGGAEVGQATFKWSDGGGTWDATGVATSASNILLNNGVCINWTTGSGADFVVGDKWYLKGINLFNVGKMIDLDRDHSYRSAALGAPNTITVDLGSAQEVKAIIIYDHNFTSAATITLEADAAATFDSGAGGNPQFSEAITWNDEKIVHYLSAATTKRYWRLKVTDAANPDTYIDIGELFLGSYLELSKNYVEGFQEETTFLMDSNGTPYGIEKSRFYNSQLTFSFDFQVMPAADITSMKALISAIASRDTGIFKPFWFNKNSATPNESWLMRIASLQVNHQTRGFYEMPLQLTEVLRSV